MLLFIYSFYCDKTPWQKATREIKCLLHLTVKSIIKGTQGRISKTEHWSRNCSEDHRWIQITELLSMAYFDCFILSFTLNCIHVYCIYIVCVLYLLSQIPPVSTPTHTPSEIYRLFFLNYCSEKYIINKFIYKWINIYFVYKWINI